MIKLIFSEKAKIDLENIVLYLANRNPQAANNTIKDIHKSTKLLIELPKLGRQRPEINSKIRSLNKNNYYIFYIYYEDDQVIEIIRVWDTRQNLDNMEL